MNADFLLGVIFGIACSMMGYLLYLLQPRKEEVKE